MEDDFHKELDMIQSYISRITDNSFKIKGWSITVFVAVLGLLPERIEPEFVALVGILSALMFWIMDASYLHQERLYRLKYQWVIKHRKEGSREFLFDLNPRNTKMREIQEGQDNVCFFAAMFSWSELWVYGIVIGFYIAWYLVERG